MGANNTKERYLDRIADVLEQRYNVEPGTIPHGVIKPYLMRIADAIDPNPQIQPDGTIKTPLARIADALENTGILNTYLESEEGMVVAQGILSAQTSRNITANDTYDTTLNNEVVVNVPNTYDENDEGKVVSSGALVAQTSHTVTENDTYDTTLYNEIVVAVQGGGSGSGSGSGGSAGVPGYKIVEKYKEDYVDSEHYLSNGVWVIGTGTTNVFDIWEVVANHKYVIVHPENDVPASDSTVMRSRATFFTVDVTAPENIDTEQHGDNIGTDINANTSGTIKGGSNNFNGYASFYTAPSDGYIVLGKNNNNILGVPAELLDVTELATVGSSPNYSTTITLDADHSYYNGYLLKNIPNPNNYSYAILTIDNNDVIKLYLNDVTFSMTIVESSLDSVSTSDTTNLKVYMYDNDDWVLLSDNNIMPFNTEYEEILWTSVDIGNTKYIGSSPITVDTKNTIIADDNDYCYYNGVRLPAVPQADVAFGSYIAIRKKTNPMTYQLLISKVPFKYYVAGVLDYDDSVPNDDRPRVMYTYSNDAWTNRQENLSATYTIDRSSNLLLWTNNDIVDKTNGNICWKGTSAVNADLLSETTYVNPHLNTPIFYPIVALGSGVGESVQSLPQYTITGWKDYYGILCIMHRSQLTLPSGWTLVSSINTSNEQYVSVYKKKIETESEILTITGASSGLMAATLWMCNKNIFISYDETLSTSNHTTLVRNDNVSIGMGYDYVANSANANNPYTIQRLTAQKIFNSCKLLIYDAYTQPSDQSYKLLPYAVGNIKINASIVRDHQLRHYSVIVADNIVNKIPTEIGEVVTSNNEYQTWPTNTALTINAESISDARILVYSIT